MVHWATNALLASHIAVLKGRHYFTLYFRKVETNVRPWFDRYSRAHADDGVFFGVTFFLETFFKEILPILLRQ